MAAIIDRPKKGDYVKIIDMHMDSWLQSRKPQFIDKTWRVIEYLGEISCFRDGWTGQDTITHDVMCEVYLDGRWQPVTFRSVEIEIMPPRKSVLGRVIPPRVLEL